MPDDLYGEVPCLFVTSTDTTLTLSALRRFFEKEGLAAFKAPERLIVIDTIPMKGIGKIDRVTLRDMLRQERTVKNTAGLNS